MAHAGYEGGCNLSVVICRVPSFDASMDALDRLTTFSLNTELTSYNGISLHLGVKSHYAIASQCQTSQRTLVQA